MKWTKNSKGDEFEQPPEGTTVGRCVRLIDLGTQTGEWKGKKTERRKVMIGWELPSLLMDDGRPFLISKIYTMSLFDRAELRSDLENWRGRDLTDEEAEAFDPKVLLNKTCLLGIAYTEKKKAKVSSILPIPRNPADQTPLIAIPARVNEVIYFSLEDGEYDPATFEKLTKWVQEQVTKSPEYAARTGKTPPPAPKGNGHNGSEFVPDAARERAEAGTDATKPNASAGLTGKPGSATDPAFEDDIPF